MPTGIKTCVMRGRWKLTWRAHQGTGGMEEDTDLLVGWEHTLVDAVFLLHVLERRHDKGRCTFAEPLDYFRAVRAILDASLRASGANGTTDWGRGGRADRVSDEAAPVCTDGEIDIEHHDKVGPREEPCGVPPYVELPATFALDAEHGLRRESAHEG